MRLTIGSKPARNEASFGARSFAFARYLAGERDDAVAAGHADPRSGASSPERPHYGRDSLASAGGRRAAEGEGIEEADRRFAADAPDQREATA